MSRPSALLFLIRRAPQSSRTAIRSFSSNIPKVDGGLPGGLPESIKRVGVSEKFPNEYPGQIYAFNWALNGDGVTPLKKSSWRITKPLDLKLAGLEQPKISPLKVKTTKPMPEAGSDDLAFELFDKVTQKTKDNLSLSDHLYCPEGHVPGTRTTVRVITNSPTLAPDIMAYLERAPRQEPPGPQQITAYILEGKDCQEFAGYAIEEIVDEQDDESMVELSVASVVVTGKSPLSLAMIAAGLEQSHAGLVADAAEREAAAKKEDEEKASK